MADFCLQCALELGFPNSDFEGLTSKGLITVLCEGCGTIQVDAKGHCVTSTQNGNFLRRTNHDTLSTDNQKVKTREPF